ncbi:MAG: PPC domain-containing protein [Chloroflexota bacterium]
MLNREVSCLVLGFFFTTVTACQPGVRRNEPIVLEQEGAASFQATTEPLDILAPENPPATEDLALTTPVTLSTIDDWRVIGSQRTGLSVAIPSSWVNLTERGSLPAMGNRLGITLMFAADSARTGQSLLAGKPFQNGAYLSGLIALAPNPETDPAVAVEEILAAIAPSATRLTAIVPVYSANSVSGMAVDVIDSPIGLTANQPTDLRTRIILYQPESTGESESGYVLLLLSASENRWGHFADVFQQMAESVVVYGVRPDLASPEGRIVVRGEVNSERGPVSASLERHASDIWTFTTPANRYASLSLRPESAQLDLNLRLKDPDQLVIADMDHGYGGTTKSITDVLLIQPGTYTIEISDFFRNSGRYSLTLTLSDRPQYSQGGAIEFGQVLRGHLPADTQHNWVFEGLAGQRITVVVEPGSGILDTVVELHGPDGRVLLELDEGFSGDPEVIAGFALPVTGRYALQVRSFSSQEGMYTISLDEGSQEVANFYDAGDLVFGAVQTQTLRPQEVQTWFFRGTTGDHVLVRVTPLNANLDADVWLLDADVQRIAAADQFPAGEPETIELTLSRDGQYVVLVRDFNGQPGPYEIALGAAPVATPEYAGSLAYSDTVLGTIKPDTAAGWFFEAQAGDIVTVRAQPGESHGDLILLLQTPEGITALEVDEGPAGRDEIIDSYSIPISGQWRLILREFFGEAASYRLELIRSR